MCKTHSTQSRGTSFFFKNYFEVIRLLFFVYSLLFLSSNLGSSFESCFEATGPTPFCSSIVGYLIKTPEIVRLLLEIGKSVPIGDIPKRANHGHEGSLTGAVLTHEEGQRRETSGLFLSKATKILERDLIHSNLFLYG